MRFFKRRKKVPIRTDEDNNNNDNGHDDRDDREHEDRETAMSDTNGPENLQQETAAGAGAAAGAGSGVAAGTGAGAGAEQDPGAVLDADLKQLQEERDSLFEQLARVQADFRNAQRRLEADKQQAIQFANAKLITALLPTIDNFERGLEVDPAKADSASILKGLQIVHDQLINVLKQHHVEVIAPEPGTPFDPNLHQALMQVTDEQYAEPTVTQLLLRGYTLHGRVLRPAQVAVSKIG